MTNKAKIREIFSSIQGEGLYVGTSHLFIRFCGCNLKCKYCDTDHSAHNTSLELSADELIKYINKNFNLDKIHYISLTGGEPMIWNEFLAEFLPKIKAKFYLGTNATISENIDKLLPYINAISADIKLPSSSDISNTFDLHNFFFNAVKNYKTDCSINIQQDCTFKNIFAKIVFDENITNEEINSCISLAKDYNLELILQPMMNNNYVSVNNKFIEAIFDKFIINYKNVRLIPQTHKFLNID